MAQFNATISERMNVFGLAPSDKWADYSWGNFKWGEGTAQIPVGILGSVVVTAAVTHAANVGIGLQVAETEAITSNAPAAPGTNVSESQGSSSGLDDVNIRDAQGYYYVFPDRTTDGEERDTPTWTPGSSPAPTWTSSGATATSWS